MTAYPSTKKRRLTSKTPPLQLVPFGWLAVPRTECRVLPNMYIYIYIAYHVPAFGNIVAFSTDSRINFRCCRGISKGVCASSFMPLCFPRCALTRWSHRASPGSLAPRSSPSTITSPGASIGSWYHSSLRLSSLMRSAWHASLARTGVACYRLKEAPRAKRLPGNGHATCLLPRPVRT